MEYSYGEEQAFAHQAYMEDMIKRIQGGSRLEAPRKNIFHRSKKDMIGRVQEVKSSLNFFHENPIVFLLEENHVVVDKLRYWLPSIFYFLMYNEWCPQLAATKSLALKEVIRQACCAIAFLCGCYSVSLTFGYCVNNQLLELAKCKEHGYTLAWPALHALLYSASDDAHMLKRIVKERRFLLELLRRKHGNDEKRIIEEACWTIKTIVRGYKDKFLEDGKGTSFIPLIVEQSYSGDFHIKRAVVVAISTATTCATKNQIRKLVKMGCLQVLCNDLDYFGDEWPLTCCLDGIENILKRGDIGETGFTNRYAPAMGKCHGWSAL